MPNTNSNRKSLSNFLSTTFDKPQNEELTTFVRSLQNEDGIQQTNSMATADLIIMQNPNIRKLLNQRFIKDNLKVSLEYKDLMTEISKDGQTRSFTETANACNYVGCADIILHLMENECSVTDTFSQFAISKCKLRVPIEGAITQGLPTIARGVDLPVLNANGLNTCLEVQAERFGGMFEILNEDIECNFCVDILEQFIRYIAKMAVRSKKIKGVQALQAGSTSVVLTSSTINNALVEMKKKLRNIALTNGSRSGKIYAYLSTQLMDELESIKDTQGRYIFENFISKCTETCREYCAFGLTIREDSQIPNLSSGSGYTTKIYMGYAEDAGFGASGLEEVNCVDCIDKRKDITRIGSQLYMEAFVPPSRVTSFTRADFAY